MMIGIARLIVRRRALIVVVTALLAAGSGLLLSRLRINPDVVDYFPVDDPTVRLFRHVGERYGGASMAIVALESDSVFSHRALTDIRDLTEAFSEVAGVASVTSLTNVIDIRDDGMGIEISRLVDARALPKTAEGLRRIRERAMSERLIRGRLVSEDGRMALIVCRVAEGADEVAVADTLQSIVSRTEVEGRVLYGGFPFQMQQIHRVVLSDLTRLVPISCVVVIVSLFVGFRTVVGVVLPLATVLLSTVLTLGTMAGLGVPLTVISDVIPVILIAVGSAYGIHVVNRLSECDPADNESVARGLSSIAVPVLLAAATTMVGFVSFIFGSYLTLIREFGLFSAFGIGLALVVALTLVPAVMRLAGRKGAVATQPEHRGLSAVLLGRWGAFIHDHRRGVLLAGGLVAVAAAAGIPRIERKAAILDYFKPDTEIRKAEAVLEERFGGSIPLNIVVRGDIDEPRVLETMQRVQTWLGVHDDVTGPQSVVDLLGEMNELMGEGRRVPDSRAKVSNLWFLLEGEPVVERMVNRGHDEAVIQATMSRLNTEKTRRLVREIGAYLDSENREGCTLAQSGLHVIYHDLDESILRTLYVSLVIALFLTYSCLLLLLRSSVRALAGLIPVAFALIVIFGVMGWCGIPLDVVTVLIGSVSIGIGVDYAIHFAGRYRQEVLVGAGPRDAVINTLRSSGRAILINVVTVMLGFLVLVFAELIPIQQFGILVAVTMAASGLGALTLLPAALALEGARSGPTIHETRSDIEPKGGE